MLLTTCVLSFLSLIVFIHEAVAVDLEPLPFDSDTDRLEARTVARVTRLRNHESFLWAPGPDDPGALLNLTIHTPDGNENVLALERFQHMASKVQCDNSTITIAFRDDNTFQVAREAWDWANGEDDRSFILVVGRGQCGGNQYRVPWTIRTLEYDYDANVAILSGAPGAWVETVKKYEITMGGPGETRRRSKRHWWEGSIEKTGTVHYDLGHSTDFDHYGDFLGFSAGIACRECYTTGAADLTFHARKGIGEDSLSLSLAVTNLSAVTRLAVNGSGWIRGRNTWLSPPIVSIPLANPYTVPGVFEFGPYLEFKVGTDIGPLKGAFNATAGASVVVQNDSVAGIDFLNPENHTFKGWDTTPDADPFEIETEIKGHWKIFAMPALNLKADVFSQGYTAGLVARMPSIDLQLETLQSTTGACDSPHQFGLNVTKRIGAELGVRITKDTAGINEKLLDVPILPPKYVPISDKCYAYGPLISSNHSGNASGTNSTGTNSSSTNSTGTNVAGPEATRPGHSNATVSVGNATRPTPAWDVMV